MFAWSVMLTILNDHHHHIQIMKLALILVTNINKPKKLANQICLRFNAFRIRLYDSKEDRCWLSSTQRRDGMC